jgi:hypothetical protein
MTLCSLSDDYLYGECATSVFIVEMSHLYFGDMCSRFTRLRGIIITLKTTAMKTSNFVCLDSCPRILGDAIAMLQKVQGHNAALVLEVILLSKNMVPLEAV